MNYHLFPYRFQPKEKSGKFVIFIKDKSNDDGKMWTLHDGDGVLGHEREGATGDKWLEIMFVYDRASGEYWKVQEPTHGSASLGVFHQIKDASLSYYYDDNTGELSIELPSKVFRWKYPENGDIPPVGEKVIGVWKDQALLCWRNAENAWIDDFHNWYCPTPPICYIESPLEK